MFGLIYLDLLGPNQAERPGAGAIQAISLYDLVRSACASHKSAFDGDPIAIGSLHAAHS
jgi:hypothetical protein